MRLITHILQYYAHAATALMLGLLAGCATYAPLPLNKSPASKVANIGNDETWRAVWNRWN